jgi:CO dehydrogenase/acetyl-CoA synthase beta subunit
MQEPHFHLFSSSLIPLLAPIFLFLRREIESISGVGQVTLVAGPSINKELQLKLERDLRDAEAVSGYAVRSTGGRIWSRVSCQARDQGFSLRRLGGTIISQLHSKQAAVTVAEIIFVTSSVEDVQSLERIGAQVRKLSHDLRRAPTGPRN